MPYFAACARRLAGNVWRRAGLVTAYRFSRAGKLFAEALWVLERPRSRSRQRMCAAAAIHWRQSLRNNDAYDLVRCL